MIKLHYYLVQRNVFIALCALAQALFVQVVVAPYQAINVALLYIALISTWIAYEYYRTSTIHYLAIASVVAVTILYSTSTNVVILGCAGCIAWLYNNSLQLRNKIIIKNVVISMCWTIVNVVAQQHHNYNYVLIIQQFLLMLALTLIYDNKDIEADRASNTPTLATVSGSNYTTLIALVVLVLSLTVMYVFNLYSSSIGFYIFSCVSISVFVIEYTATPPAYYYYYYYYVIDGIIILQLVLA